MSIPPFPTSEPRLSYAPGSAERATLELDLERQESITVELIATIDARKRSPWGSGDKGRAVAQPMDTCKAAPFRTRADAKAAIQSTVDAAPACRDLAPCADVDCSLKGEGDDPPLASSRLRADLR